jgi:hypothetical protein
MLSAVILNVVAPLAGQVLYLYAHDTISMSQLKSSSFLQMVLETKA